MGLTLCLSRVIEHVIPEVHLAIFYATENIHMFYVLLYVLGEDIRALYIVERLCKLSIIFLM